MWNAHAIMSCRKAIATQIIGQGGDYVLALSVLALKGDQETLHDDVRCFFEYATARKFEEVMHQTWACVDKDHGRLETRGLWQVDLCHLERRWADAEQEWQSRNGRVYPVC